MALFAKKIAGRVLIGTIGIGLLASCGHLMTGGTPKATLGVSEAAASQSVPSESSQSDHGPASTRKGPTVTLLKSDTGRTEAPGNPGFKVVGAPTGVKTLSIDTPEVVDTYPDGSPKTLRHFGFIAYEPPPYEGGMLWPTGDRNGNCILTISSASYSGTLNLDPRARNIRGYVDEWINDCDEYTYTINGFSQSDKYAGYGMNLRPRVSEIADIVRPGANTFSISGGYAPYTCTGCCPRFPGLATRVDISYDLPDPTTATPTPAPSGSTSPPVGSPGPSQPPPPSPSPSPTQAPSPSPSSGPLSLHAELIAFSPNGDGAKDTNTLTIRATGPWALEVSGQPGRLGGTPADQSGDKSFAWDGKVAGKVVRDGKYTLRLSAGGQESRVNVLVDTKAPRVSDAYVAEIDAAEDQRRMKYRFSAQAADDATVGAASGIDAATGKVEDVNVAFEPVGPGTPRSADGGFEATALLESAKQANMKFELSVRDKAGNLGKGKGTLSEQLVLISDGVKPSESCDILSAEKLAASVAEPPLASGDAEDDIDDTIDELEAPPGPTYSLSQVRFTRGNDLKKFVIDLANQCYTPLSVGSLRSPFFDVLANRDTGREYPIAIRLGLASSPTASRLRLRTYARVFIFRLSNNLPGARIDGPAIWASDVVKTTIGPNEPQLIIRWNGKHNLGSSAGMREHTRLTQPELIA